MNQLDCVRPLLRIVGVFVIAMGLPSMLGNLRAVISMYSQAGWSVVTTEPYWQLTLFSGLLVASLQVAIGFYLLLFGNFVARLCVRRLEDLCPRCGFDITKSPGPRCPECGFALASINSQPPAELARSADADRHPMP